MNYECYAAPNLDLYTVTPVDSGHLLWSTGTSFRNLALSAMVESGINVVSMSSWGEDFLPCDVGWSRIAPMQCSPESHDEMFDAAGSVGLLIIPFIESRDDWALRDEFPIAADGRVAPGAVSQITNLIERYLQNSSHPEWASRWAQVYDQQGDPRYAVSLIHASSNRLGFGAHGSFAEGFDLLADEIHRITGIRVGFFIDPLPPDSNAPGRFKPSPQRTGWYLQQADSILGIQAFIPEIWMTGSPSLTEMIKWKREFSRRWAASGVPFLMDVSPGYDASIVFPASITYGFTQRWQDALTSMVGSYANDGLAFNSWNGYTEGMAAVPTHEHGDAYYIWLQALCELVKLQD